MMRALVVEDDAVVARFITKGLQESGFSVLHAADGHAGLDAAINEHYDIAILDLMLPGRDGMQILKQMRELKVCSPVLILSAKRSIDDRVNGLRMGGDDYLVKPFAFRELLARVQALTRRAEHAMPLSTLELADLSMDLLSRIVTRCGMQIHLQPREFSLLEYLIRNAGHVVSKTMIMECVWNYHYDPGTNVVEARISKLREKVDKGHEIPLIHTVRGIGYVLRVQNC